LEPEPDGLDSVEALHSFLLDVGFFDATDDPAALTSDDLAAFVRLRGQLAEVLSATDEAQAARGLNSILAECRSVPYVTNHDDSVLHLHFAPPKATPAQQAGASSAMGLALVLCEEGLKRFGTCADDNCVDVFVDNSKNTSRRFCSNKCSNRTAVAAHRARVRGKKQ